MLDIGKLADFFAGEPEPPYSPSIRGIAESDSEDGEVEVYLGEMEQVYQTSVQPLYETDEDGELVYDDEGEKVQMVDENGDPMTAEQVVYDADGNPVPVLDSDGNPVFSKVQLVDADGDPILEYDADGNPIAQTDAQGNPIYAEDEDGNRIPVLDDAGEQVYTYEDDGTAVPLYQVVPVEESQVAVIESIGTVRAGESPVISMGGAASTAIAAGGWGDSLELTFTELGDSLSVTETIANEAHSIATGTEAHFWHDASGAHVATEEGTTELGYAFTVNATSDAAGAIITYDNQVLSSWTQSALSFWDGLGLLPKHIMGFFGRLGQRVGRLASMHMSVDETGLRVANGPDGLLAVTGTGNGYSTEYLGYTIDGYAYLGGLKPLHVYGEGDLAEASGSYSLAAAVMDDPDTELHNYPGDLDTWVYVDVPVNAPDPDLWIISDGAIAGELMTLEYAWRTQSVAGGAFDFAGAGKKYLDGNEEVISPDGYNNDDSEAVLNFHHYVADAETAGYNRCWFRLESTTARHYVVASAYPDLTYSAEVGTDLAVAGDITDGSGNVLSNKIEGMTILSYGHSTWADFLAAYNAQTVVYCRASSNSNPATGSQTRLAFMAYVSNADAPANVEFQYYRSVSSHTASQQGDQVYVYKLTNTGAWSVTVREASVKVAAGTGLTMAYSGGTATFAAKMLTGSVQVPVVANGEIPEADRPQVTFPSAITGSSPSVFFTIGSSPSVWHMRDLHFGYNLIGDSTNGYTGFYVRCVNTGSNTGSPWVRWLAVWN